MENTPPFIQPITINKVRHLTDITIQIDDSRPRHLILTGPNGCGKTSVLRFLEEYLNGIMLSVDEWIRRVDTYAQELPLLKSKLDDPNYPNEQKAQLGAQISNIDNSLQRCEKWLTPYKSITAKILNLPRLVDSYHKGKFLICFFEAKRVITDKACNRRAET